MKKCILLFFISLCCMQVYVQVACAQTLYFQPSVPLSETLNSEAEESLPIYSQQDSTLFFVRTMYANNTGGRLSGQDIWYSKKTADGKWTQPKNNFPNLNNKGNNAVVGISKSGNTLYLLNEYREGKTPSSGLSSSSGKGSTWDAPSSISLPGLEKNQGNFYSLYVAPTEDVVLISAQLENSIGQEDLYVSTKDSSTGQWSAPVHLGLNINTTGFEISPYLSADQKTLFFSSNGHPGYGNADIFMSQRLDSTWTNWSRPVNLGDQINSAGFDAYFTAAGSDVFFVSNRRGGSSDIYYSRMVSEEERQQQMASRINREGRIELPEPVTQNTKPNQQENDTQALIEETRALLEEFNRLKDQSASNEISTPTGGNNTEEETPEASEMLFELNSASIQPRFQSTLLETIEAMKANPSLKVEVVGHADDTGGKDYNLKLSIDRAIAVKRYLMQQGISERRIISYGKGSTQPVSNNQSPEGREKNRRVVVRLI